MARPLDPIQVAGVLSDVEAAAVGAFRRTLIAESCAGAVVGRLPPPGLRDDGFILLPDLWPPVPIAQTLPSLGPEVAGALAGRCWCEGVWSDGDCDAPEPPPFAAAYSDAGGVRTYYLASAACDECGGSGWDTEYDADGEIDDDYPCCGCSGTGARTDVKAIADRYQPDRAWRDEDTARCARFDVRR